METLNNSRLMEMLNASKGKVKVKEERVLNYLLEHEDEIQNLSIAQIAEAADVSKATVVRFCKSLDFNGLKDFKVWYEAGKGTRYTDITPVRKEDETEDVLSNLSLSVIRTMENTLSLDNKEEFSAIASDIVESDSIIVAGEREVEIFANVIAEIIHKYFPEKKVSVNTQVENADFCLALSVTGKEKATMDMISNVVFAGGKADVISACPTSLIAKAATNAVIVANEEFFSMNKYMMGKIAILAVIDYLEIMIGKDRI